MSAVGERNTVSFRGEELPLTLSVARAAKLVGIGQTAMYEAVNSGEFDSIKINNRKAVLTLPLLRKLGVDV